MSTRIRARAEAATPFGRNRKNACNCVTARCTRFAWSKKRSFRDQKADKSSIKMTGSRTLYRSLCLRCHGRSGKKSCHHAFRMPANRIQNRVIRLRDKSIIRIFLHLNEVFCAEPLMALCLDSQQRRRTRMRHAGVSERAHVVQTKIMKLFGDNPEFRLV